MNGDTFICCRCLMDEAIGLGHARSGRYLCRECAAEIGADIESGDPLQSDRAQLAQWPASRRITWPHPLSVVDLETTGLEPDCALTEIAVVQLGDALQSRERAHIFVDVPPGTTVDPWVVDNTAWGRTPRPEWIARGAVTWLTALTRAGRMLDGRGIVAHYLEFDLGRLRYWFRRAPEDTPGRDWILGEKIERRSICTWNLASVMLAQGLSRSSDGYPSRSLDAVCRALGVPLEHHHHALADALATAEVNRRLLMRGM